MRQDHKNSRTFQFLKRHNWIGDEQKYGHITIFGIIGLAFRTFFRRILFTFAYKAYIFEPLYKKHLRPAIWRALGCKVGKNVHIGHAVRLDFGNAEHIIIEDDVVISNGVTILCHRRDISNYKKGEKATQQPFIYSDVVLERGCQIGINATVMPGVRIGEGSIVGSCALVTKSVPAWSIAGGVPAKVIKSLE
ncbi:MAG: acyltransferase [Bacteroidales bacterium]|nr:acyltransferase [Bacteroidales bacterium]